MDDSQINQKILEVANGNELVRQQIINQYKPYIINIVSHICKRFITWSDEESSIGLLAFNKAIDTYESSKGRAFLSYAYFIINRNLINFFHQNQKGEQYLSLDYISNSEDSNLTAIEIEKSIQYYEEKVQNSDLVQEILELEEEISHYDIVFEELESFSPKHKDTKIMIDGMVENFLKDKNLIDELIKKKRFPAALFVKKTGYSVKTIERHRKYLITLIIISLHPEWTHLLTYISNKSERSG
ncbi:MAG TPA: sigma factor [Pseudobacteroides sp.]|uniref:sigma factor n=1 Tax=Pseudobacteroides sp. TaxID=1968840 RepID=UPI002F957B8A